MNRLMNQWGVVITAFRRCTRSFSAKLVAVAIVLGVALALADSIDIDEPEDFIATPIGTKEPFSANGSTDTTEMTVQVEFRKFDAKSAGFKHYFYSSGAVVGGGWMGDWRRPMNADWENKGHHRFEVQNTGKGESATAARSFTSSVLYDD